MYYPRKNRSGIAWLELLLVLAVVALIIQLFPSVGSWLKQLAAGVLFYGDIRNYSWFAWGCLNVILAIGLLTVRFWPEIKAGYAKRQAKKKEQREIAEEKRLKEEKKRALDEEREMLERLEEGRSRRIY